MNLARIAIAASALACLLLAPSVGLPAASEAADCSPERALLRSPDGKVTTIPVEIADTAGLRAQGLMFRESLPAGSGMLFVYEWPQPVAFWMKNTLIPLDMLFIDQTGRVKHVHAQAIPHDETPIPGAEPEDPAPERVMVLEINGGEAARLDLVEGSVLASPLLDQAGAAWPCK